jgi:pSer/pThr/pTyr-binding forkhead associated (FHA) protein
VQPSPVGVVPMATAVQPRPVPTARAGEAPLAILPEAAPTSSKEGRLEPPPTVPVPIDTSATISSLATYSAPSKAPPASSTPSPASPLTRDTDLLPIGGKARLLVLRGQKINVTYPLYDGDNFIGRADERPVDIDLEDQELPDRIWSSRQHALIRCEEGILVIEDLNSSNGTFINRTRLYPGQKRVLNVNDIIQIGTVQMRVVIDPSA